MADEGGDGALGAGAECGRTRSERGGFDVDPVEIPNEGSEAGPFEARPLVVPQLSAPQPSAAGAAFFFLRLP